MEERDCATIIGFLESIVRGQCLAYIYAHIPARSPETELDFDRFYADVVEKTNLVGTLSQIIKMD